MYQTMTSANFTTISPITGYNESFFEYLSPVNLTLAVYIIIQNSMIIYHYIKDWKRLSSLLFILIAAADIGSACSAIARGSIALLCLNNEQLPLPSWVYVTNISFGNLCFVASTFLGMVLTIVKTINIINPFYRLQERALKVCLAIFSSLGLVLTLVDMWYLNRSSNSTCVSLYGMWNLLMKIGLVGKETLAKIVYNLIGIFSTKIYYGLVFEWILLSFEILLPGIVVLICMFLQMFNIKSSLGQSADPRQNTANRANLTIFMISLLYLLSISFYSYLTITVIYSNLKSGLQIFLDYRVKLIGKFTLPLINAALFPTILILRKPELRATYRGYISTVLHLPVTVYHNIRNRVRGYTDI